MRFLMININILYRSKHKCYKSIHIYCRNLINMKRQRLKLRRFMIMTGCIHDILNEEGCELMWRQDMAIFNLSLCPYHMSCDTHHHPCPRFLPKKYYRHVWKRLNNSFPSYRADKLGVRKVKQAETKTDRQTDRQTQAMTITHHPQGGMD